VLSPHPLTLCHTTLLLRDLVAPFRCPASASAFFSLCFFFFLLLVRLDPSGLCLSSSPASASSRTPTLVLFGSVHQWILHSSDRTLLASYDAKALINISLCSFGIVEHFAFSFWN